MWAELGRRRSFGAGVGAIEVFLRDDKQFYGGSLMDISSIIIDLYNLHVLEEVHLRGGVVRSIRLADQAVLLHLFRARAADRNGTRKLILV